MTILQESILNKAKNFVINNKGKLLTAAALAGGAYAASHYDVGGINEKIGGLFKHDDNQTPKTPSTPKVEYKETPKTPSTPKVEHKETPKTPSTPKVEHKETPKTPSTPKVDASKYTMKNKIAALDKHHDDVNASTNVPDQSESVDSGYNYKEPAKHETPAHHEKPTVSGTFDKIGHGLGKSFDNLYSKAKQALTPDIATLKPVKPVDNPDAGEDVPDIAPASKSVFAAPEKPTTPVMGNRYKVPTWNERMRIQNVQNDADYDMNDW